uniref:Uncharacterized protein n=1 Tax=Arion vulgaris TaxID=1028688 RepID=A0A0B6Z4K1_9EUPU
MTSSLCVIYMLSIFTMCNCRALLLDDEGDIDSDTEQELATHFFIPVELSFKYILRALKDNEQDLRPTDFQTFEKSPTSNTEVVHQVFKKMNDENQETKRKIFWQPLGYMPASARAHNSQSTTTGNGNQGSSSNVFRYG